MIKIIKNGQKDFIAKCQTCGCEFSYQVNDITTGLVVCPCCAGYVAHKEFREPRLATDINAIPCKFPQQTTAVWIAPDVTSTSSNTNSQLNLKQFATCAPTELQTIHDLCVDYDGFNTVEGLKSLIDDIRAITEETLK